MSLKLKVLAFAASAFMASQPVLAAIDLKIWHMEQPPHRVARIQELINEFNAANPDIKVSQEPQSWDQVYAKVPAAIAAGNAPDMLFALPDFTTVIRAVTPLPSVADFVKEMDAKHGFVPAAVNPYTYSGGVWAVPLYNMGISLWYHKKMLSAANVKVPTTSNEWLDVAKALNKNGVIGMGLPANKQLYTDQTVYSMMVNDGAADIFNADGTIRFNNPKTVEAYKFYKDLYKYSSPDAANWTWGEAEACFASEKCAMILQFTVISTYDSQNRGAPQDLGVAPVPHANGERSSSTIAYPNSVIFLAKDENKRAASRKFIAFLLEPANYGRFLNMEPGLFMPVTRDGAKSSAFWSDPLVVKYKPQVEQMMQNVSQGMLFGFTGGRVFPSIGPISAQNMLAETLQKVVIDNVDPALAVKEGQAKMQAATVK